MDSPFESLGKYARLFAASKGKNAFSFAFVPPVAFHQICSRPAAVPGPLMGLRLQLRAAKLALMTRRLAVTHSLGPPTYQV